MDIVSLLRHTTKQSCEALHAQGFDGAQIAVGIALGLHDFTVGNFPVGERENPLLRAELEKLCAELMTGITYRV